VSKVRFKANWQCLVARALLKMPGFADIDTIRVALYYRNDQLSH